MPKAVDLVRVEKLAAEGMWNSVAGIGRILGVPKQTMLDGTRGEDVREAVERGKARWTLELLRRFNKGVVNGRANINAIFGLKQVGFSDRQTISGPDGGPIPLEIAGAADRLIEAVARLQAARRHETEGAPA